MKNARENVKGGGGGGGRGRSDLQQICKGREEKSETTKTEGGLAVTDNKFI